MMKSSEAVRYGARSRAPRFSIIAITLVLACSQRPEDADGAGGSFGTGGAVSATGGSSGGANTSKGGASGRAGAGGSAGTTSSQAGSGGQAGKPGFAWPGGIKAAVTLTYDDGIRSHIDNAAPELDKHDLKGTFFTSGDHGALPDPNGPPLNAYQTAWAGLASNGHELAGHTFYHPCDANLSNYTLEIMEQELDKSLLALERLGVSEPYSFAYPCASDVHGIGTPRVSYAHLVAERFFTARVAQEGIADPRVVELQHVPLIDAGGKTGAELRGFVDQAIADGGWLVFMFHGVGGDYLITTTEAHAALASYLAEKKSTVWTKPMRDVARYIADSR